MASGHTWVYTSGLLFVRYGRRLCGNVWFPPKIEALAALICVRLSSRRGLSGLEFPVWDGQQAPGRDALFSRSMTLGSQYIPAPRRSEDSPKST